MPEDHGAMLMSEEDRTTLMSEEDRTTPMSEANGIAPISEDNGTAPMFEDDSTVPMSKDNADPTNEPPRIVAKPVGQAMKKPRKPLSIRDLVKTQMHDVHQSNTLGPKK